jgi:hypothetical protein
MNKISIIKDAAEKAVVAELSRTEFLSREGWKLTAGTVVVLGFQLLDARALLESNSAGAKTSCYASLALMGLSLLLTLCSQQVKDYASYPRGYALWDNLKPENVSGESAEEALMQMLLKTREQNARQNDVRTRLLYWSRWLLFAGILSVAASQMFDAFTNNLG